MTKYSGFPAIPIKLAFCKRVAQCLNPNLPSGVHIKTLETLSGVLERIGVFIYFFLYIFFILKDFINLFLSFFYIY